MQEQRFAKVGRFADEKLLAPSVQSVDTGNGRHDSLDDRALEWVAMALRLPGVCHQKSSPVFGVCPGR